MNNFSHDCSILIVENNEFNLELLLTILTQLDCRLLAANSGEKAIRICKDFTPDLILMDVQMPGMDGFETADKLQKKSNTRHVPILFTSTFSDTDSILRCFEVGGVDYISKPFKKSELLARINTHLSLKRLREELKTERDHLNSILKNMLPAGVIDTLKSGTFPKPETVNQTAVLFTDFQNFSKLTRKMGSKISVDHLNLIYYVFDEIVGYFGLERVKTIGDAYFAVGGINTKPDDLYLYPLLAGLKMQEFVSYYNKQHNAPKWQLRVGFTVGPVTSGVIGYQKIAYDVWGDTVNLANLLENKAMAGHIAIPESVFLNISSYIEFSKNQIVQSSTWGTLNIYQCYKVNDNLPAGVRKKFEEINPEDLLKQASSRKSLLKKIFQLPGDDNAHSAT